MTVLQIGFFPKKDIDIKKCQIDTFHEVLPGNLVFFSFLLNWHNRTWIFGPDHWIALEKLHKYWKFHVRYLKIVLNIPWSNCAWNEYFMFQISNFSLAIFFWLDQINSSSRIINIIVITKFSKSDVSTYLRDDSFLKMQKHLPKSSQSSGKDKPVLGTMISLLSLFFFLSWLEIAWEFELENCEFRQHPTFQKLVGLGRAKAGPKIWPVGHCFWVARPDPGQIFVGL